MLRALRSHPPDVPTKLSVDPLAGLPLSRHSGEHLVQHQSCRVYVDLVRDGASALLLWRAVRISPNPLEQAGERDVSFLAGNSEVAERDVVVVAEEEEVGRLHVPMDNVVGMDERKGVQQLKHPASGFSGILGSWWLARRRRDQPILHAAAPGDRHQRVQAAIGELPAADVMQDPRVHQAAHDVGLPLEALTLLGIARDLVPHQLQRPLGARQGVRDLVDVRHSARAQQANHGESPIMESLARGDRGPLDDRWIEPDAADGDRTPVGLPVRQPGIHRQRPIIRLNLDGMLGSGIVPGDDDLATILDAPDEVQSRPAPTVGRVHDERRQIKEARAIRVDGVDRVTRERQRPIGLLGDAGGRSHEELQRPPGAPRAVMTHEGIHPSESIAGQPLQTEEDASNGLAKLNGRGRRAMSPPVSKLDQQVHSLLRRSLLAPPVEEPDRQLGCERQRLPALPDRAHELANERPHLPERGLPPLGADELVQRRLRRGIGRAAKIVW